MNDSTVINFPRPDQHDDPLTELIRGGARQLIQLAVETELRTLLDTLSERRLPDGRAAVVRSGLRIPVPSDHPFHSHLTTDSIRI